MSPNAGALLTAASDEIHAVFGALHDKGPRHFKRAFGAAGLVVAVAYLGVYRPPQQKSARLQAQIDRAKQLAEYGAQYKDLRDQLNGDYTGLPPLTDREQWLANSLRESFLAGGLQPESLAPVKEEEVSGLLFQRSSVSLTLRFPEFFDWLMRVENAKPLMHMTNVDLYKRGDRSGLNVITCDVTTVIPKQRFR